MVSINPFPGMNPYLEQRWGDVHAAMITYARDMLQDALPDDLRARMQERVFIESAGEPQRTISPDVHVYEWRPGATPSVRGSDGATTLVEPLVIHVADAEVTQSYLELIDVRSGGHVVTVIELLSPSNKAKGPGRNLYLQKQLETVNARANMVEIDLLRGGEPATLTPPSIVPRSSQSPYHVSVFRGKRPWHREYYAAHLRDPLPTIRIPLRPTDPDVQLNLQELLDLCHRRGRYDDIDYQQPLDPPFGPEDTNWIHDIIREKKLV